MSSSNPLSNFLYKAGWNPSIIVKVLAGLHADQVDRRTQDLLARKLWRFVSEKQHEAVLNALAADALERQRLARHYEAFNVAPNDEDAWQHRLDELFDQVKDQRDPGDEPPADDSQQ